MFRIVSTILFTCHSRQKTLITANIPARRKRNTVQLSSLNKCRIIEIKIERSVFGVDISTQNIQICFLQRESASIVCGKNEIRKILNFYQFTEVDEENLEKIFSRCSYYMIYQKQGSTFLFQLAPCLMILFLDSTYK